jgi:hypothetical protein
MMDDIEATDLLTVQVLDQVDVQLAEIATKARAALDADDAFGAALLLWLFDRCMKFRATLADGLTDRVEVAAQGGTT